MSATLVWFVGGVLVAAFLVRAAAGAADRGLASALCSGAGWIGLFTCGLLLEFGPRWGVELMPVPAGLGMAASAAFVVVPLVGERERVVPLAIVAASAVAIAVGGGAIWMARTQPASPWSEGAVLLGLHWSVLAAAAAFALAGGLVAVRSTLGPDDETPRFALRATARDSALRAVLLLWMGWYTAGLVHTQFFAASGLGSRSEWFAFGATLLATGGLLAGWDLGDDGASNVRSILAPVWVAAVVVAAVLLSFGFGSPLGLSLAS